MRILMIGNSYTYYNEMPRLLETIAAANGKQLSARQITKGARRLQANLTGEDELAAETAAAAREHWDALFLQEQSLLPAQSPQAFIPAVEGLAALFRDHADRVVLYQTWARAADSPELQEKNWTREEMDTRLQTAYSAAAERIGAEVSPVGQVFTETARTAPEFDLWQPDRSHPSYFGSCLAAAVHYKTIFGEPPRTLGVPELTEEEKRTILCSVGKEK